MLNKGDIQQWRQMCKRRTKYILRWYLTWRVYSHIYATSFIRVHLADVFHLWKYKFPLLDDEQSIKTNFELEKIINYNIGIRKINQCDKIVTLEIPLDISFKISGCQDFLQKVFSELKNPEHWRKSRFHLIYCFTCLFKLVEHQVQIWRQKQQNRFFWRKKLILLIIIFIMKLKVFIRQHLTRF